MADGRAALLRFGIDYEDSAVTKSACAGIAKQKQSLMHFELKHKAIAAESKQVVARALLYHSRTEGQTYATLV
jgi:hypothetical protein